MISKVPIIKPPTPTMRQTMLSCEHSRAFAIKNEKSTIARLESIGIATPEEIARRRTLLDLLISAHEIMSGCKINKN